MTRVTRPRGHEVAMSRVLSGRVLYPYSLRLRVLYGNQQSVAKTPAVRRR